MSSVKLSEVSESITVCPEGYLFECDSYDCRCRRNIWSSIKKLSTGAIIGIVVGVICFFILIVLLIVFMNRKYNVSSKSVVYGVPGYGVPGIGIRGVGF
jgi:hypothetical protein